MKTYNGKTIEELIELAEEIDLTSSQETDGPEYHDKLVKIVQAIAEACTTNVNAEHHLRNLLAIVHRDGGHYAVDHGLEKATEDAITSVCEERNQRTDSLK